MFRTHSKTNNQKTTLLSAIAIGIVLILLNLITAIRSIIAVNQPVPEVANPALVQQQTIQKAFDLFNNQTLPD